MTEDTFWRCDHCPHDLRDGVHSLDVHFHHQAVEFDAKGMMSWGESNEPEDGIIGTIAFECEECLTEVNQEQLAALLLGLGTGINDHLRLHLWGTTSNQ